MTPLARHHEAALKQIADLDTSTPAGAGVDSDTALRMRRIASEALRCLNTDELGEMAPVEVRAREVVKAQDAFLSAQDGALALLESHNLSLAIDQLREALNG